MDVSSWLGEPGVVDWIQAGGTLIAVAIALVALYQVQRSRRWEDRSLLIEKVYSPLHKALTEDRILVDSMDVSWLAWLRGNEIARTLRHDGLWDRLPKDVRRGIDALYGPSDDEQGALDNLFSEIDDVAEAIRTAVTEYLRPVVCELPDLDLYPIDRFVDGDDYGKAYLPGQFLKRDSLPGVIEKMKDSGCAAPGDLTAAVAEPPRERGYRTRLKDGCRDYIHFDKSSERSLKVALHELRWKALDEGEFFQSLVDMVEELPEVQRWQAARRLAFDDLDAELSVLRSKIHDPS